MATNQVVTMKQLLESGVHFGHQTRRWNPKMKRFIFTERNGIYIIDLQQSLSYIDRAYEFVKETVAHGGTILFVGTKKQAQEAIAEQATRVGMPYVNQRWLGGMLTNFQTVHKRLQRLKELEQLDFDDVPGSGMTKKELLVLRREKDKLEQTLGGIRDMARVPSAVWIVDTKKEHIAVGEAHKLGIPVVAILDTNCDPDEVDYKIPGNDDAIRSVTLLTRVIADAVADGLMARRAHLAGGRRQAARASSPPTSRWPSGSRSCCAARLPRARRPPARSSRARAPRPPPRRAPPPTPRRRAPPTPPRRGHRRRGPGRRGRRRRARAEAAGAPRPGRRGPGRRGSGCRRGRRRGRRRRPRPTAAEPSPGLTGRPRRTPRDGRPPGRPPRHRREREMANITAADVKQLRDATGAGMMDARRPSRRPTATSTRPSRSCASRARPRSRSAAPSAAPATAWSPPPTAR